MGEEKRRSERLEGRFKVIVREKLATWETRTLDVSARGCRIELQRPLSPGMLVQLVFDLGPGVEPLVAHAQVAWASRTAPLSAGIAFLTIPRQASETAGKPAGWIDRVLAAYVRRISDAPPAKASASGPRTVLGRVQRGGVIVPSSA